MSTIKILRNGVKKVANKRRRKARRNTATKTTRNTTATKTVANKRRRRRRNGATLSAAPVKTVANRKHHRRRRRNGITRSRNGLLGNTTGTVKTVASLLFGLVAVKVEAPIAMPLVSQFLTPLGFGNYVRPITEAGLAVLNGWVAGMVGKKLKAPEAGKMALIGGLTMAAMDLVIAFLPSASAYNPFAIANGSPVLLTPVQSSAAAAMSGGLRPRVGTGYMRPIL